jgi:SAM-dependent methyltransferase
MDALFFALHSGLDHEAPGSAEDTLRALALTGARGRVRILDIGSGPGAASLTLLRALPEAEVTAVDLHAPFLAAAEARADASGLASRFRTVEADMAALPFDDASFDLLWSEGAAYSIGVPEALAAWRRLLAPDGRFAFTDAVWLTPRPHPRATALWRQYPTMTDIPGVRAWIEAAGWQILGDFLLPEAAWDAYYGPLEARLAHLEQEHGPDAPALAEAREEIAVRRAHGDDYGYAFFVVAP